MKKKDIQSILEKLGIPDLDLDALKHLKFRRKGKSGRKWAMLAVAVVGAAVAYQLYAKSKKA